MELWAHVVVATLGGLLVLLVALRCADPWTRGRFPKGFTAFLTRQNEQARPIRLEATATAAFDEFRQQHRQSGAVDRQKWINEKALAVLEESVGQYIAGESVRIDVDQGAAAKRELALDGRQDFGTWTEQSAAAAPTLSLHFTNNGPRIWTISNAAIGDIAVGGGNPSISLVNCWVRSVALNSHPSFRAERCVIGSLKLDSNGVDLLDLRNCTVGRVSGAMTQFPGVATISADTELAAQAAGDGEVLSRLVQPYRTLRLALREHRCDEVTEKIIHATELRLERVRDAQPIRLLSYLFDLASHYGNRPHRALGSLLALFLAYFVWAAGLEWADVPTDCKASSSRYEGWLSVLCEHGTTGVAARGAMLVAQAITNPFGLFNAKPLVVPESFAAAALLAVFSLLALTLFAIAIIGIRRRFKVA